MTEPGLQAGSRVFLLQPWHVMICNPLSVSGDSPSDAGAPSSSAMSSPAAQPEQAAPAFRTPADARRPWALVLAAGSSRRMGQATGGTAKQFLLWQGAPLYWHSALTFSRSAAVEGLVFVFPAGELEARQHELRRLDAHSELGLPWLAVAGGAERHDSVLNGLRAVPPQVQHVLVHDAARPFLSARLVHTVCQALKDGATAVVPGLPVTDTIKLVDKDVVCETLPRHRLVAVQTPQGFLRPALEAAHARRLCRPDSPEALPVTDDAMLMEQLGHAVRIVPGEKTNMKITTPEDLALLRQPQDMPEPRTGMGYDVHRYASDADAPGARPMKLGGVPIPHAPHVLAHSDGDVLLHALMDALLGCACLGDIGQHFPDADPALDNVSSALLLDRVLERCRAAGLRLCHADMTIVAQRPRLAPYKEEIRTHVARLLGLSPSAVNVKATTEERLGFTGREEGIKAYAVVGALATFPRNSDV